MIFRMSYWVDQFVYDVDEAVATYEKVFGWKPAYHFDYSGFGVKMAYLPISPCPGGFSMGGNGLALVGPSGPTPLPVLEHIFKRRGEGFGLIPFHSDDYDAELNRVRSMGVTLDELVVGVFKEIWLDGKYMHGMFVLFGGGEGALEKQFSKDPPGIHAASVDPKKLPKTGFIMRLGNVAHVVKNLDEASKTYEKLFHLKPWNRWDFQDAGIVSAFVRIGERGIQLVQPTTTKGPIAQVMEEIGEGIGYAVLMTDNAKECARLLRSRGVEVIESTMGGKPVVWVPRKYTHGILYQILEIGDYYSFFKLGKLYDI